jgi:DNA-binding NarL/FixJ family response regulator
MPRRRSPTGSKKRRVLLIGAQPLLCEGLETILGELADVELIGPLAPDADWLNRLPEHAPHVVLLAEEGGDIHYSAPLTTLILDRFPDVPVIRVALEEDAVRLYTTQTLPARSADLIEAIRRVPIPIRPDAGSSSDRSGH